MTLRWHVAILALLSCVACKGHTTEQGQLVASGRNFEISLPEFDQVLQQAPTVSKDQIQPARGKILDALITQKLFAHAATDENLDRDVAVMQSIEAARRQILAAAYVDRLANGEAKPTGSEVAAYYDAHPKLYAGRKVYTINQIALPAGLPGMADYQRSLDTGGMAALDARLAQDGISVRPTNVVIAADLLPDAVAAALDRIMVGAPVSFSSQGAFHLGIVAGVQDGSLSLDEARPAIEARLQSERRQALVKAQADRLRAQQQVKVSATALKNGG